MPLEAPAPCAFRAWFAEDADKVPFRVTGKAALWVGIVENLLEAHDLRALLQALGTHHGRQQGVGHVLLILLHFAERQPVASMHLCRDEMPAGAVFVVEFKGGLGLLFRLERGEKCIGRVGHFCGSLIRMGHGAAGNRQR